MALADMKTDPWFHAKKNDRNYITPEDVTASIRAGASEVYLLRSVLAAIELGTVEDVSCTAFVALKVVPAVPKVKKPRRATPQRSDGGR
jgi:hypothetical protein